MQSGRLILPTYRADIDGLRAIAVLAVVGYHAAPDLFPGGFVGVDVFFVISGFLISTIIFGSLQRNSFSFAEFYGRRIRRIFPALLLVLAASLALGWFLLLPDEYKQLGLHVAGGAGFVSNFVLLNEGDYFDSAAQTKPLLHLWSLGIEEQFYIVWPFMLWLAWKSRNNLPRVLVAVCVISFALDLVLIHLDPGAAFYAPHARFWELLFGSLLAYSTLYRQDLAARFGRSSLAGAALILVGILGFTNEDPFPGLLAALPAGGAVLIIASGTQAWLNRLVLSNRVLVWFGLISYPLYLWHWPLLTFARLQESGTPAPEVRAAAVLASIALAWLTYRLVEIPVRVGGRRTVKAIGLATLMAAAGYAGYSTYQRDGLGFRFPDIVRQLGEYKYDVKKGYRAGSCFLSSEQDYSAFSACDATPPTGTAASILIWGDSHAAQLVPGYQDSFDGRFRIIQRTASGCPPILDLDFRLRPQCRAINDHVLELVREVRPGRVVLAAAWSVYDWKRVEYTVARLRKIGIANIDLVGPVPAWTDRLPRQIYLYYKRHRSIPERMTFGLKRDSMQLDPVLSDFSRRLGINYLSPAKILCNEAGCLTMLGERADTLTAWDYAHLTDAGSRYLVSRFPKTGD